MAEQRVQRRLAAILAADVVGYSRLMGADETGTRARFNALLDGQINPAIAALQGRLVKTMGDGFLVEFASVVDAVQCAADIQAGVTAQQGGEAENSRMVLRIGIHLGDVIVEGDDIHGDGVNVAARLEAIAEPGGICVSTDVERQCRGKVDLGFDDLGAQDLKNIAEPVQAFAVRLDPAASPAEKRPDDALALPDKPSVAVLPFDNISGDPEQEYFSDGISEDIITELSKISGLFVIARHSAFAYKGQSVSLKQVGRDLGVLYVMEGSVRRAGERLRITAQLIDASTDQHLWGERYDRDMDDIFAVQDEVARAVAAALAVALKPDEGERLSRAPTRNIDAYDIYLRTRSAPWPPTRENVLTARNAYRRIAEIDPSFAGGPAGQSLTHSFAVLFGFSEHPEDDKRLAQELARAGVALDDSFAQAFSALGLAHSLAGQYEEGLENARHAVALQPGDADAHTYLAFTQMIAGEHEAAYASINAALRLDPQYVNGPYLNVLGCVCFLAGRYAESIEVFQRNVDRGGPLGVPVLVYRTASFSMLGRMEEAKASAAALLEFFPAFSLSRYSLVNLFGDTGDRDRVLDALRAAGLPE